MLSVKENVPLAPLTTFGIGGSARYLVKVRTEEKAREAIESGMERTAGNTGLQLHLALSYGGRQEIADAFKKLLAEKQKQAIPLEAIAASISPEEISRYMYTYDVPDPDLIIRTSGEVRLSGFLLWQSAYSEFYFCDVNWPAFRRIDFLRAIRSYQQRDRRFGH